jgi:diguanylate cyclase (GGDEF)-like protein
VAPIRQAGAGVLWLDTVDEANGLKEAGAAVRGDDGRWHWQPSPLQPISGSSMLSILADADGTVWFGGDKGLFRYDPRKRAPSDARFGAVLRKVSGRDGVALPGGTPRIPHAGNTLRFEFAAPGYDIVDANRFQVKLEGLDDDWSPWSREAYRDYTNLPEGDYRFRVRARNVYGQVGREATFAFRVLPPWYRTGWAWLAWIAGAVALVRAAVRWRLAALRRRNRELAALVERRTHELKAANDALAEQSITDPLTGLRNRRYLHDHIEQDVAMARRHYQQLHQGHAARPQPMALLFLMVDVDHFKEVNDTWGHAAGDRVLQQLRDILLSVTRDSDTPVRWGGEEFLIVARFAPHDAGPQFAERIRAAVAAHPFDLGEGRSLRRTCSVGFASFPFFGDDPDRLNWEQVVNLADECLYAAKRHGRDAWAGVAPMTRPPAGDLVGALQASFAAIPGTGPLPVVASWCVPSAACA